MANIWDKNTSVILTIVTSSAFILGHTIVQDGNTNPVIALGVSWAGHTCTNAWGDTLTILADLGTGTTSRNLAAWLIIVVLHVGSLAGFA